MKESAYGRVNFKVFKSPNDIILGSKGDPYIVVAVDSRDKNGEALKIAVFKYYKDACACKKKLTDVLRKC